MNCVNFILCIHTRTTRPILRLGLAIAMITAAFSGCSTLKVDSDKSQNDILKRAFAQASDGNEPRNPHGHVAEKVRVAGGLTLGDTDNLAFTAATLSDVINELIDAEKWNSARTLVRLYPDVVAKILFGAEGTGLTESGREIVAKLFDQQWGVDGKKHWEKFVKAGKSKDFIELRNRYLALLEQNKTDEALDLGLSEVGSRHPSPIAKSESLRLDGVAFLMQGKLDKSIDRLQRSLEILERSQPYQASHTGLLLGEAQRHAGNLADWTASWESAINIQSRWLADRELCDPEFWNKAAFLRPVSTAWSPAVVRRLEQSLRNENLEFGSSQASVDEAVVWAIVGTQSLKRHESQNAILAFKKAEALVSSRLLKEELQMQQALAMIDGGQQGPASAILLRLGSKESLLGDRAQAILATLKLQNGSLAQGMNLLQTAIKTSNQWPTSERLRAQADYGLAYLMRGREEQGIALLNQVYEEFIEHKSYDHAAQCLVNIATYYEKTDQTAKHRNAVSRIKQLEDF